jgi:ribose transport system ATP-binding protein
MNPSPESDMASGLPYVVEMTGITKSFSGVIVLDQVELRVRAGECVALLGENGAGKSTLMKILGGIYTPDRGTIRIDGREVQIENTLAAKRLGISFIHQEFNLIEHLSVAENVFLGHEVMHGILIDDREAVQRTFAVLKKVGAPIHPQQRIAELTTGEKQLVEIARAFAQEARILVMDEPTASLTNKEIATLFELIRTVKSHGVSVIYISHRLEEIFEIGDRVVVLRNGRNAGVTTGQAPIVEIVRMMLGRDVGERFHKLTTQPGEVILEVRDLSTTRMLRNISFSVRQGEILGIFGIAGAGQRDLAMALFGLYKTSGGEISMHGRPVTLDSATDAIASGLGLLTDNRKQEGLLLHLPIVQNISLSSLGRMSRFGFIQEPKEFALGRYFGDALKIRATSILQHVRFLSGGNQQKVVLARALSTKPEVIILNEPTRGVDIGAKVEIYDLMNQLAAEGKGLIMISSELPEVLGMSDRILVLYRGAVVAEYSHTEANQHNLLTYAMGGSLVE